MVDNIVCKTCGSIVPKEEFDPIDHILYNILERCSDFLYPTIEKKFKIKFTHAAVTAKSNDNGLIKYHIIAYSNTNGNCSKDSMKLDFKVRTEAVVTGEIHLGKKCANVEIDKKVVNLPYE